MPVPAVIVANVGRKAVKEGAKKLYKAYRKHEAKSSMDEQRLAERMEKMRENSAKVRAARKAAGE